MFHLVQSDSKQDPYFPLIDEETDNERGSLARRLLRSTTQADLSQHPL